MTSPIERASPTGLAFRAMDSGAVLQEQFGAELLLGPGADPAAVERAVAERSAAVPRLRQRLRAGAPGWGTAALVDGAALPPAVDGFPRLRPSWRRLATDAARWRAAAVARWPATARQARAALRAAGGMVPPRASERRGERGGGQDRPPGPRPPHPRGGTSGTSVPGTGRRRSWGRGPVGRTMAR
jgi:hypothetical protein